jgi:hypothetical protein
MKLSKKGKHLARVNSISQFRLFEVIQPGEASEMPDVRLAERVAEVARNKLPLQDAALGDEHEYASLPLCVIDAVFSIGVKYASTKLVPPRWAEAQTPQWPVYRRAATIEHSISDFLAALSHLTSEELAVNVFKNSQRTSSRSGILKAEAVRQFAAALQKAGIERFADVGDEAKLELAETYVKEVKGQSSGISFDYFRILAGHETVKADRMVCRFVARATGLEHVAPIVAKRAVIDATALLKPDFPNLKTRILDYVIWNYESRNAASSHSSCPHQ